MTLNFRIATMTLLPLLSLMTANTGRAQTPQLKLVVARDHIEGSFPGPEGVFADNKHIFLASAGDLTSTSAGNLFVLEIGPGFPLITEIPVSSAPLNAVRGDGKNIYMTGADEQLYVYSEQPPFGFVAAIPETTVLNSLVVVGTEVCFSAWQSVMTIDGEGHLYLSQLNPGDFAACVDKATFTIKTTFGTTFESGMTEVFNRASGKEGRSIPNPLTFGGTEGQVALFADKNVMVQTLPGCCGTGFTMYDAKTLGLLATVYEPYADSVAAMNNDQLLVVGTELGTVVLYDISTPTAPVRLSEANLIQLTGQTGPEAIEIRSLWIGPNGLVFAASSWGDDISRSPTLPSFFVLKVTT